ncbi:MAG: HEPN/Toprim-associated domain-containing protein [Spirochaetia bacterium]|nr:HEPN/Toprim-associated domain-containing protein [Spirochaetia bacterium]
MGSESRLKVNNITISYSKNYLDDHTALFYPSEKCQIEYEYADKNIELLPGYKKNLELSKITMDLLGYGRDKTKERVENILKQNNEIIDFDQLILLLNRINIDRTIYDETVNSFFTSDFAEKVVIEYNKI